MYVPLDNFSAFCFESYIKFIKSLLRKGDKPLQQIASRLEKLNYIRLNEQPKYDTVMLQNCQYSQENISPYTTLKTISTFLNCQDKNNCFLLLKKNNIHECTKIIKG